MKSVCPRSQQCTRPQKFQHAGRPQEDHDHREEEEDDAAIRETRNKGIHWTFTGVRSRISVRTYSDSAG